jgi:hypothetical protein
MAKQSSHGPLQCASAQVWCQLDTARRQQAIAVVAQMALNVVKTQAASLQQERDDEHSTGFDQAP